VELYNGREFHRYTYNHEKGTLKKLDKTISRLNQHKKEKEPKKIENLEPVLPTSSVYEKWIGLYQPIIKCQPLWEWAPVNGETEPPPLKVEDIGMNIVNTLLSPVIWSALNRGDLQEVYGRIGALLWNYDIAVPVLHFNENIPLFDQLLNLKGHDAAELDQIAAVHMILEFFGNIEVRKQVFPLPLPPLTS
jgi:hypothetical protein